MYDPVVVDAFLARTRGSCRLTDARIRRRRSIGDARALDRDEPRAGRAARHDAGVSDGLLAVTSLSRAVSGGARPSATSAR